jgi:hypothetical protein
VNSNDDSLFQYVSFFRPQNAGFIDGVTPVHLILVHVEKNEMYRLRAALLSRYQDKRGKSHSYPRKLQDCRIVLSRRTSCVNHWYIGIECTGETWHTLVVCSFTINSVILSLLRKTRPEKLPTKSPRKEGSEAGKGEGKGREAQ